MLNQFESLSDTLAKGGVVYGGWLTSASKLAIEAYMHAPFDYVGIDTQHSPIDPQTAVDLMDPLKYTKYPAIVRVNSNDAAQIGKALDGGASAVIVPMVETAKQAAYAVAAAHYPPNGVRSFGAIRPDVAKLSLPELDARGLVFLMVETAIGFANVEEIAAVPGVTGIYIGPADLSIALGLPPLDAFSTDQLAEPITRIRAACEANGILLGAHAIDVPSARRWVSWGARLISVGSDSGMLRKASADLVAALHDEVPEVVAATGLY